jgi:hypothetical protein
VNANENAYLKTDTFENAYLKTDTFENDVTRTLVRFQMYAFSSDRKRTIPVALITADNNRQKAVKNRQEAVKNRQNDITGFYNHTMNNDQYISTWHRSVLLDIFNHLKY